MKTRSWKLGRFLLVVGLALWARGARADAQTTIQCTVSKADGDHVAISWNTVAERRYTVETKSSLTEPWAEHTVLTATNEFLRLLVTVEPGTRFFRVAESEATPPGMVMIPAGTFQMGDTFSEDSTDERPVHDVYVSAFYMDRTEVTKELWDEVYAWATTHGYSFDHSGLGKAANHPVQTVNWYDVVKWCNARSEKEGRVPAYYTSAEQTAVYRTGQVDVQNDWVRWDAGYRLPTEVEWEKAARGGVPGHRFPWSHTDNITHELANYNSSIEYSYDISTTRGYHPDYDDGVQPCTSPVGSFPPTGSYGAGLYDMLGNVWEWCWDLRSTSYYGVSPTNDPRGPTSGGPHRIIRGGSCYFYAKHCRTANRGGGLPGDSANQVGFRCVRAAGQ